MDKMLGFDTYGKAVILYSAAHMLGGRCSDAADAQPLPPGLALLGCIVMDIPWALVVFVSWFAYWPVAVIFTLPFLAFNAAIVYKLFFSEPPRRI
jgi:hypothetical protein